jgi:uncharacterized protein (DUF58 family)
MRLGGAARRASDSLESEPGDRDGARVVLTRRHIFIVPTRHGLAFAGMLFLMLIGATNYQLSLGFALTFLLGAMGAVSILHAFRTLAGLEVCAGKTTPGFAGETVAFGIDLTNCSPRPRLALALSYPGGAIVRCDLSPGQTRRLALFTVADRRGWLKLQRLTVSTCYPLGLFRAWAPVALELRCLVYPRPEAARFPPPAVLHLLGGGRNGLGAGDDFLGLRDYRPGDSPRHIAWKAAAQERGTLTKLFGGHAAKEVWLDWEGLAGLETETRLSRLTRWVLDCDALGIPYGLRLPGTTRAPALTPEHRRACLEALALFGQEDTDRPGPTPRP